MIDIEFVSSVGSVNDDLLGYTIARVYKTPPSLTAGQRRLCCLARGGVCTRDECRVIRCIEEKFTDSTSLLQKVKSGMGSSYWHA